MKTRNKVFYILILALMLIFTIYFVSAYTPTRNLCFDEDGRGIECYGLDRKLVAYYEFGVWDKALTQEQVEHLFSERDSGIMNKINKIITDLKNAIKKYDEAGI